jgi:hypothetical protein
LKLALRDWRSNWDTIIEEDGLGREPREVSDELQPTAANG